MEKTKLSMEKMECLKRKKFWNNKKILITGHTGFKDLGFH